MMALSDPATLLPGIAALTSFSAAIGRNRLKISGITPKIWYNLKKDQTFRIIRARKASKGERELYEERIKNLTKMNYGRSISVPIFPATSCGVSTQSV